MTAIPSSGALPHKAHQHPARLTRNDELSSSTMTTRLGGKVEFPCLFQIHFLGTCNKRCCGVRWSMDSPPCLHEHVRKAQGRYLCITCGSEVDNQNRSPIAPKLGAEIVAPPLVNSLFGLPIRGLKVLSITLPLAVLVLMTVPLAHLITYALGTLCHEMGHSTIAILTGHLAVPTFDLAQGGGLTHVFERQWWLLIVLAFVTAHTAFRYWRGGVHFSDSYGPGRSATRRNGTRWTIGCWRNFSLSRTYRNR
jgi:hypothetical protein